jgi:putative protein-disulfide isomerase
MNNTQIRIYYFFDVLCGWCYGFSPVIQKLHDKYKDKMHFEILSGGMVTGTRIGPIGQVAAYIKDAHKTVEDTAGVPFGEAFLKNILEEGSTIFSSIPPSLAMVVFKTQQKENAIPFAGSLQKAVYYDGIDPNDYEAYGRYAASFGLDEKNFVEQMRGNQATAMMEREFEMTNQSGVQGFPTLIAAVGQEMYVLTRGYAPFDKLDDVFSKLIDLAAAQQKTGG